MSRRPRQLAHDCDTRREMALIAAGALLLLVATIRADSVCKTDYYGVLEGNAYQLPERYLPLRLHDWAILVPPVCRGAYVSGMEARVCTWVTPPGVRIVDWGTAVVSMQAWRPTYSSVNVTVWCASSLQTFQPLTLPLSPDPYADLSIVEVDRS